MLQTFKNRAAEIADHAHNPRGAVGDGVDFLRGLDETERQCMSRIILLEMATDYTQCSAQPTIELNRRGFESVISINYHGQ